LLFNHLSLARLKEVLATKGMRTTLRSAAVRNIEQYVRNVTQQTDVNDEGFFIITVKFCVNKNNDIKFK